MEISHVTHFGQSNLFYKGQLFSGKIHVSIKEL